MKIQRNKSESFDDINFNLLNGHRLKLIVIHEPRYFDSKYFTYCNLSKLSGFYWSWLLRKHPQLSEFCDWDKFSDWDWSNILTMQPILKKI